MSVRTQPSPPLTEQLARWFGGAALAFAGTSHVTFARRGFRAQVPRWVPMGTDRVVLLSGAVEIALGAALLGLPRQRRRVGGLVAAFLVGVFPGNISQ